MTAIRTIPTLFPYVHKREVFSRQTATASLMRRLAMAQNWIWSKFVRVYAGCGYEGEGNELGRIGSNESAWFNDSLAGYGQDPVLVKAPDAGEDVLPLSSFVVPPNPGASRRIKVQGRAVLRAQDPTGTGNLPDAFEVLIGIYTMEGVFTGIYTSTGQTGAIGASNFDWSLTLQVPQDKLYQCRVFLRYTILTFVSDSHLSDTRVNTSYLFHGVTSLNISARYDQATAAELAGDDPVTTWLATADSAEANYLPLHAAILGRIRDNIAHLYGQRGPELCQTWLNKPNANTNTFTEVGRYVVWISGVNTPTELSGRLLIYCTHGGAGNEVRIKLNGAVVQTLAALAVGETEVTLNPNNVIAGAELTITIEAKSTAASADWGTSVYGVSFWESDYTMGLPGGTTIPAAYQPLDEAALSGDFPISWKNNRRGQRAGIYYLIQNDRWLAYNRMRHLVGDWRHRVYKRYDQFEDRVNWTPGAPGTTDPDGTAYATGRPKNITVRGDDPATDNDVDGYGKFPFGAYTTEAGYVLTPFSYPSDLTYALQGLRLAKFWCVPPNVNVTSHLSEETSLILLIRGRRSQPNSLAMGANGLGPLVEEVGYIGKGYFEAKYGTNTLDRIPVIESGDPSAPSAYGSGKPAVKNRTQRLWTSAVTVDVQSSDKPFIIRGRLPSQPLAYTTTPGLGRPEGMLFEIELNSVYLADQPLNSQILKDLP